MAVDGFFHIVSQTVPHKQMLGEFVHIIFVAKPGEGVPAVVGCMLFPGSAVEHAQLLEEGIKLMSAKSVAVKFLRTKFHGKGGDGAVEGNNAVFAGAGFDAASEILFLRIDLDGFVGGDAEAAVDHHEYRAG